MLIALAPMFVGCFLAGSEERSDDSRSGFYDVTVSWTLRNLDGSVMTQCPAGYTTIYANLYESWWILQPPPDAEVRVPCTPQGSFTRPVATEGELLDTAEGSYGGYFPYHANKDLTLRVTEETLSSLREAARGPIDVGGSVRAHVFGGVLHLVERSVMSGRCARVLPVLALLAGCGSDRASERPDEPEAQSSADSPARALATLPRVSAGDELRARIFVFVTDDAIRVGAMPLQGLQRGVLDGEPPGEAVTLDRLRSALNDVSSSLEPAAPATDSPRVAEPVPSEGASPMSSAVGTLPAGLERLDIDRITDAVVGDMALGGSVLIVADSALSMQRIADVARAMQLLECPRLAAVREGVVVGLPLGECGPRVTDYGTVLSIESTTSREEVLARLPSLRDEAYVCVRPAPDTTLGHFAPIVAAVQDNAGPPRVLSCLPASAALGADRPSGAGIRNATVSRSIMTLDELEITGALDADEVRRVVERAGATLRACVEFARERVPDLAGVVRIEWSVDAQGSVERARVVRSTLRDRDAQDCLLRQTRRMRFPDGGATTIRCSLSFAAPAP